MGLSINGAAVLASVVVLSLAGWVIRRPIEESIRGESGASASKSGEAKGEVTSARLRFAPVATGFSGPVDMQFIPGRSGLEAVVLEKGGRARLVSLPEVPASPAAATGSGSGGSGSGGSAGGGSAAGGSAGDGNAAGGGAGGGNAGAGNAASGGAGIAPSEPGADVFTLEVHTDSELGLLGLAFHPRYEENGLFYLNTNPKDDKQLRTRISEWVLEPQALGKELAKQKRVLLEIDQPYKNHDGGQVAFGSDGYLYIGMGDGGSRNDPQGHGQNLGSLLGKMLRINVNVASGYGIPADNPFLKTPSAKPEIWAYGFRNPWRFSWDPKGRLIAADVGQDSFEEVDIVPAGANLGWKVREAAHCFDPKEGCTQEGMVEPIFEYAREAGQSITGGYVYLGERIPWLKDKYVVGDFVTGRVWAITLPDEAGKKADAEEIGVFPHAFSAFARSPNGELYALDFARGLILQILPA